MGTSRVLRLAIVVAFALWNVWWLQQLAAWAAVGLPQNDWSLLAAVDPAAPYVGGGFHWSVPAAWLWAGLVVPLGFPLWVALHFAALATIRDWRVAALALLTFPFWFDVAGGNMVTFAFVAAWHALAGRRLGIVAFVVLAALIPRPIMLPVLAWLLWRSGTARYAFAAAAAVVVAAGLWTGTLGTWLGLMLAANGEMHASFSVGPSALIGAAWLPIGLVLGAWLTMRGRLGLASLAISPYLIHYYLVFGLLELRRPEVLQRQPAELGRVPGAAVHRVQLDVVGGD